MRVIIYPFKYLFLLAIDICIFQNQYYAMNTTKALLVSIAILFLFAPATTQSVSVAELIRVPYISSESKEQREFYLYLPYGLRSSPDRKWPVLMFLHGDGERGNGREDLDWVTVHGPLYEAWVQKRDLPFIIISPQLPLYGMDTLETYIRDRNPARIPRRLQAGVPDREPDFDTPGEMKGAVSSVELQFVLYPNGWQRVAEDLIGMVHKIIEAYHGDPDKVYLTGLSSGGYGTWYMASKYPDVWAAICPIVGWGHPDLMQPIASHQIPVWAFAGGRDDAVPAKYFYPGLNKLEMLGDKEVRFTIQEDMGHDTWKRVYAGEDVYAWMLSHKRK